MDKHMPLRAYNRGTMKGCSGLFFILVSLTLVNATTHPASNRIGTQVLEPKVYELKLWPKIEDDGTNLVLGHVDLTLLMHNLTDRIVLNAVDLVLNKSSVGIAMGDDFEDDLDVIDVTDNEEAQTLTIHFEPPPSTPALPLNLRVSAAFTSQLRQDGHGFYIDSYHDQGHEKRMAVTQFEPAFARTAFPCVDEPEAKATFKVSLGAKEGHLVQSNMPLNYTEAMTDNPGHLWHVFEETPPMSTYTLAFAISELSCHECDSSSRSQVQVRVCARDELIQLNLTRLACDSVPIMLDTFTDLLGMAYPLPKLDLIAPPNKAGAMENWGLMTFAETYLLIDQDHSSSLAQELVLTLIAHELTHQWFGNLVTLSSWNEVWLNEGLTSFVCNEGIKAVRPDMLPKARFLMDEARDVMLDDATVDAWPLQLALNDPELAFNSFAYQKGAALMAMIHDYFSPQVFYDGLKSYLNKHKYQSVTSQDLWIELTRVGNDSGVLEPFQDLESIMKSWIEEPHYPKVTVTRFEDDKAFAFYQDPYLDQGQRPDSNVTWQVPLAFAIIDLETGQANHTQLVVPVEAALFPLLDLSGKVIMFNVDGSGYFRVNYGLKNWQQLITMLQNNHTMISPLSRAMLVDDALTLAFDNHLDYWVALDLVSYFDSESDLVALDALTRGLERLWRMLRITQLESKLQAFVSSKVTSLYMANRIVNTTSAFDNKFNESLTFRHITSLALLGEVPALIEDNLALFATWMEDKVNPYSLDLRPLCYCQAIAHGTDIHWRFLLDQLSPRPSALNTRERVDILTALGCSTDDSILKQFLNLTLSSPSMQFNAFQAFHSVGKNKIGRDLIWPWMEENWEMLMTTGQANLLVPIAADGLALNGFTSSDIKKLEDFLANHDSDLGAGAKVGLRRSIQRIKENQAWHQVNFQELQDWFDPPPAPGASARLVMPLYLLSSMYLVSSIIK